MCVHLAPERRESGWLKENTKWIGVGGGGLEDKPQKFVITWEVHMKVLFLEAWGSTWRCHLYSVLLSSPCTREAPV